MGQINNWPAPYTCEFVTAQNHLLCKAKKALHKPSSDGHKKTQLLWEKNHKGSMPLSEAVDLCRKCHKLAPFCFYNGNTFAGIIRDVVNSIGLPEEHSIVIRSLAGHIVAGVADELKEEEFRKFCDSL